MLKLISQIILITLLFSCGRKAEDSPKEAPVVDRPQESRVIIDKNSKLELYDAIMANDSLLVGYALANNPHLNYQFTDGETPLTKSILQKCSNEIIKKIMNHTATDLNFKNKMGMTPLNLVIRGKNLTIFDALIQGGVNVNLAGHDNMTPLSTAIYFANETTAISLVRHGADVLSKDISGLSLELLAEFSGFVKLAKLINKVKNHKAVNLNQIKDAIDEEDLTFLKYLLTQYPQYINIINDNNLLVNVLQLNNRLKRRFILDFLLESGVNAHNTNGISPLHYTIDHDLFEEMKELLLYGAQINHENNDGFDALNLAAKRLKFEITNKLYSILEQELSNATPSEYEALVVAFDLRINQTCKLIPSKKETRYMFRGASLERERVRNLLKCN